MFGGMIAGIIPGRAGAVALLNPDGSIFRTVSIPAIRTETPKGTQFRMDAPAFAKLLREDQIDTITVERTAPVERADAAYAIGFSSGIIEGVLATLDAEKRSVSHPQWRSDLSISTDYWAGVERVNDLARRHWPKARFAKSIHGHRQQLAALLALYSIQVSHHEALIAA